MNGYLDIERVTEDDRDFSQMDPDGSYRSFAS
jgi:hypothetical protein